MMFVEQAVGLIALRIALAWQAAEETWMSLPGSVGAWARKEAYDGLDNHCRRPVWRPVKPKYQRPSRATEGPTHVERSRPIDVVERAGFSLMTLWEGWHPSELAGAGD